jgi:hypothetical protein
VKKRGTWRRAAGIGVAAATLLTGVVAGTTAAYADPPVQGSMPRNVANGLCLDYSAVNNPSHIATFETCDIWNNSEQWSWNPVAGSPGYFQVRNIIANQCLYGSPGPYAQVAGCNVADLNQHWFIPNVNVHPTTITERATGYRLGSVPSSNKALTGNFQTANQALWYDT